VIVVLGLVLALLAKRYRVQRPPHEPDRGSSNPASRSPLSPAPLGTAPGTSYRS
jgi:hypothetical protein